jgi:hypothetical protein
MQQVLPTGGVREGVGSDHSECCRQMDTSSTHARTEDQYVHCAKDLLTLSFTQMTDVESGFMWRHTYM